MSQVVALLCNSDNFFQRKWSSSLSTILTIYLHIYSFSSLYILVSEVFYNWNIKYLVLHICSVYFSSVWTCSIKLNKWNFCCCYKLTKVLHRHCPSFIVGQDYKCNKISFKMYVFLMYSFFLAKILVHISEKEIVG